MRFVRTTASQPFALIAASGAGNWPPALLTRPSMRPWAARASATVDFTNASSRMSHSWMLTVPPEDSISAWTVSSLARARPTSATVAPRLASSWAVHRPIPEPAPVTTTTWSAKRSSR